MKGRRDFLKATGAGFGVMLLPIFGRAIAAEALATRMDVATKKRLADTALTAAKAGGASYCDVRIGRYLRQFVITREDKVQNIVNTESTGVGIRVIADGAWGFAATSDIEHRRASPRPRRQAAGHRQGQREDCRPSRCSSRRRKGVGEVSWATPIVKNAMEVPIKDKVDLLLARQRRGDEGRRRASSTRCCSWSTSRNTSPPPTAPTSTRTSTASGRRCTVTAIDKASGKFRTRDGLSSPMGMGYEYLDAQAAGTASRCPAAWSCTPIPTT